MKFSIRKLYEEKLPPRYVIRERLRWHEGGAKRTPRTKQPPPRPRRLLRPITQAHRRRSQKRKSDGVLHPILSAKLMLANKVRSEILTTLRLCEHPRRPCGEGRSKPLVRRPALLALCHYQFGFTPQQRGINMKTNF